MTGRTTKLAIALIAIVMAVGGSALAFGAGGSDRGAPAPAAGDAEGRDHDGRDDDDGREEDDAREADDRPVTGVQAERAGAAAVKIAGGGKAGDVERADDPGEAFEVEVVTDGTELEVTLDHDLGKVGVERDD